jgi:hypothetical protein
VIHPSIPDANPFNPQLALTIHIRIHSLARLLYSIALIAEKPF